MNSGHVIPFLIRVDRCVPEMDNVSNWINANANADTTDNGARIDTTFTTMFPRKTLRVITFPRTIQTCVPVMVIV